VLEEIDIKVSTQFVFEVKLLTGYECVFLVLKRNKSLSLRLTVRGHLYLAADNLSMLTA
jgi:hypothetical protein